MCGFALAAVIWLTAGAAQSDQPDPDLPISSSEEFEALHQAWLDTPDLQLERPYREIEPPPQPQRRQPNGFFRWLANLLSGLGPLFRLIFYLGLAAIAGGILYFVLTQFTDIRLDRLRKRETKLADDVLVPARPDEKTARSLLEEADALAQQGQFSEAVHLLLFRSIQDIQTRSGQALSAALTSREIGSLTELPERPRSALSPIVALVERSFFGGRDLKENDWRSARASYEDFAFGEAWT